MKKLFTILFLSVAIFSTAQQRRARIKTYDWKNKLVPNLVFFDSTIKSFYNYKDDSLATILRIGTGSQAGGKGINNLGFIKNTSAFKILIGGSGSFFSYKRTGGDGDSSFLYFSNRSTYTGADLWSMSSRGTAKLTVERGFRLQATCTSITGNHQTGMLLDTMSFQLFVQSTVNGIFFTGDTNGIYITGNQGVFKGLKYVNDYSADYDSLSLVDSMDVANMIAANTPPPLGLDDVMNNDAKVSASGGIKTSGGDIAIGVNDFGLYDNNVSLTVDWDDDLLRYNNATKLDWKNLRTYGTWTHDTLSIHGGITEWQDSKSVSDDGILQIPDGKSGWGTVYAFNSGAPVAAINFYFSSDGTVSDLATTGILDSNIAITDSDGFLCVYDNGANVNIRNRMGGTRVLKYVITY